MTLFNLDDIQVNKPVTKSKSVKKKRKKQKAVLGKRYQTCAQVIGTIDHNDHIHYVSAGEWSMHDLTCHIIDQIGPSHLHIATWSISPVGCKHLINYCKNGKILSINALFDWRIKVRTPEAHQLAMYNFNKIYLHNCHAKTSVIHNADYHIAIVGSANYTNNPRIEAGTITENKEIAQFHIDWIQSTINRSQPFDL